MSPRTARSTVEPIATSGGATVGRRIRRAAALPMPDGESMTPLAPADPLGAGHDKSTLRSLTSTLAAARTTESEPAPDPSAWRPGGTNEVGREALAVGAEAAAAPAGQPQRRSGGSRLTSKLTERPFLVAAAVAGAVVASTPFLTSNAKDHTTTYQGLGQADPVAAEDGAVLDRHPDAHVGQISLQDSTTGGGTASADNLLDPDAGAWHGSEGASAAGDPQTGTDYPQVPGVLAADGSGSGGDTPASSTTVGAAQPPKGASAPASKAAETSGHPVAAAAAKKTVPANDAGAPKPATSTKATDTAGPKTPAKTTVLATDKPSSGTTVKSGADTTPVTARVASTAPAGAGDAATTKPAAAGSVLTPVDDDKTATDGVADTPAGDRDQASSSADDSAATDRPQVTDAPATEPTVTDAPVTDRQQATSGTASGQIAGTHPAPQWSTKVFTSSFTLRSGESVNSNRMRITMQPSGDLVISDENGTVRWSSHTAGQNNYATFKTDGELVVRSPSQQTLWSSRVVGHPGAKLVIQNDGNVTILSADDQTLWAAGTQH